MKQRPILFSTPMVQAILAGRKTMTRRIVKHEIDSRGLRATDVPFEDFHGKEVKCPYGKIGDVLWVRETWARAIGSEELTTSEKATAVEISLERFIVFKADSKEETHPEHPEWGKKLWKPSIHMPKDAARIWLRITGVRVERLWDISEQDAKAEGVFKTNAVNEWYYMENVYNTDSPLIAFERLWQSINGEQSWTDNPWVWVVEFERIENPNT